MACRFAIYFYGSYLYYLMLFRIETTGLYIGNNELFWQ
jgi:hypothetical protein